MTSNQNHEDNDAFSSKRVTTFDNGGVAPWLGVNDDVVFFVMMRLGVVDFYAFSRVCKSWRSVALSNKKTFMASKPPISVRHISRANKDDWCHLEDFERRKFKTIIPDFFGRFCVGSTCGYLILFARETRDFWLVIPITRHELRFPDYPFYVGGHGTQRMRGTLVFSPSISRWVFILLYKKLSFYIAGKQGWNHVLSIVPILDLHFCKGKIFTLDIDCSLRELRLNPNRKRKWTLLETKNCPNSALLRPLLVSSSENLYVIDLYSMPRKLLQLDFGEMKWVSPEKETGEYAFFISRFGYSAAIKPESWLGSATPYKSLGTDKSPRYGFYHETMWYFPHDCLNVNRLDE